MKHWEKYHEQADADRVWRIFDQVLIGAAVVVLIVMVLIAPRVVSKAYAEVCAIQSNSP